MSFVLNLVLRSTVRLHLPDLVGCERYEFDHGSSANSFHGKGVVLHSGATDEFFVPSKGVSARTFSSDCLKDKLTVTEVADWISRRTDLPDIPPMTYSLALQSRPFGRIDMLTRNLSVAVNGFYGDEYDLLTITDSPDYMNHLQATLTHSGLEVWSSNIPISSHSISMEINTKRVTTRWMEWASKGKTAAQRFQILSSKSFTDVA